MEPLFFKAENVSCRTIHRNVALKASMEPLFFKAENSLAGIDKYLHSDSFNGAAFFQSGKFQFERYFDGILEGFNGAAFFQSGKSISRLQA